MSKVSEHQDHIGIWHNELSSWMPTKIFDAHVHLGPPDIVRSISPQRRKEPLTTFTEWTYDEAMLFYDKLYSGKQIAGLIAFGFPLREVDVQKANEYIAQVARLDRKVHPFILADPKNIDQTIKQFYAIEDTGIRFVGVKPYYDLLGIDHVNSVFHCCDSDFVPLKLLQFMDKERLALMLHTSGAGVGDVKVQEFVKTVATEFSGIKIILAHMGRYIDPKQWQGFFDSGVINFNNIFLEMSSASSKEIYVQYLSRPDLWDRLLFGSDVPYGLITGTECFSDTHGTIFITRDDYTWSDPKLSHAHDRSCMTYNTYHTIKALKDALDEMLLSNNEMKNIKENIFYRNVMQRVLENDQN